VNDALLIVFSGLPLTGKTTIARKLAAQLHAAFLRIDSLENPFLKLGDIEDLGYRAAQAVAEDNLRLGNTVVADCVNPLAMSRDGWRAVAQRCNAGIAEIEVRCSDCDEHRRRAEERADLSWTEIASRTYEPWHREHIVIETAGRTVDDAVAEVRGAISDLLTHR